MFTVRGWGEEVRNLPERVRFLIRAPADRSRVLSRFRAPVSVPNLLWSYGMQAQGAWGSDRRTENLSRVRFPSTSSALQARRQLGCPGLKTRPDLHCTDYCRYDRVSVRFDTDHESLKRRFEPDYTAQQPRRPSASYMPPWEPEIYTHREVLAYCILVAQRTGAENIFITEESTSAV
jgi:hypothetical protein